MLLFFRKLHMQELTSAIFALQNWVYPENFKCIEKMISIRSNLLQS